MVMRLVMVLRFCIGMFCEIANGAMGYGGVGVGEWSGMNLQAIAQAGGGSLDV